MAMAVPTEAGGEPGTVAVVRKRHLHLVWLARHDDDRGAFLVPGQPPDGFSSPAKADRWLESHGNAGAEYDLAKFYRKGVWLKQTISLVRRDIPEGVS